MAKDILLTEFFPPRFGGVERSCQLIAERFGADMTVVAPDSEGSMKFDEAQSYTIVRRSLFSGKIKPSWLWLIPWLRQQKKLGARQIIFGHYSAAVSAGWLLKRFGLEYAVLVHGNDVLTEAKRLSQRKFVGRNLQGAAWVGVNSTFTADLVRQYGVVAAKVIRTHPAVSSSLFNLPHQPATDGKIHMVTACRLVLRKNIQRVIQAVQAVQSDVPNLVYDIIGDGPERQDLESQIRQLNLGSSIIMHGNISDGEKWKLMQQASVAVMVPEVREEGIDIEGLGLFFIEAAAMGLPIVASNTGGITDIVQHETNGLLVDPQSVDEIADALHHLLRVPEYQHHFGKAGPGIVAKEFTADIRVGRVAAMVNRQWQSNSPLVSIIIPAYQSAMTMRATLESALAQTWSHYEIIVVDDGSTDDLKIALQPFQDKIKLIQQANQGAPVARNRGAAEARGEFLLFLDADIFMEPEAITDMVVTLQTHPQVSYVYSDFKFGPKNFHLFEFTADRLRQQNYIHTTSLIRRADFPGFDLSLKRFQDWDLWLTMLQQGKVGIWIPKRLFVVKESAGGMSKWVPSFVYNLPLIGRGVGNQNIASYREAERVIQSKHRL